MDKKLFKRISYGKTSVVYEDLNTGQVIKRNLGCESCNFINCLRELSFLSYLKHPFIVELNGVIFKEVELTKEDFEKDLHDKSKDDKLFFVLEKAYYSLREYKEVFDRKVEDFDSFKLVFLQMFLALEYMHSLGIIHRDIKPENVLIFEKGSKLCDFDMSKFENNNNEYCTPSVVTHLYRAPEILTDKIYSFPVDIWAMGIMMAEIIKGEFCFFTNENKNDVILNEIYENLPGACEDNGKTWEKFFNFNEKQLANFNNNTFGDFNSFIDLLKGCLKINPEERFTCTQILNSKFFSSHREYIDEIRKNVETQVHPVQTGVKKIIIQDQLKEVVLKIFDVRHEKSFFQPSVFFTSLAIFYQYINVKHNFVEKAIADKSEINYIYLHFRVCFYMALKMKFPTMYQGVGYSELDFMDCGVTGEELYKLSDLIERKILTELNFNIYFLTIYDKVNVKLEENQIKKLLELYLDTDPLVEKDYKNVLKIFFESLK